MFSLSISLNVHVYLAFVYAYLCECVCESVRFECCSVSRSLVRFSSCSALVSSRCNFRLSIRWLYSLLVFISFFLLILYFLIWFFLFHSSCLLTTLFFKCVYSLLRRFFVLFFFSLQFDILSWYSTSRWFCVHDTIFVQNGSKTCFQLSFHEYVFSSFYHSFNNVVCVLYCTRWFSYVVRYFCVYMCFFCSFSWFIQNYFEIFLLNCLIAGSDIVRRM